jgi:hypothetical protein
MLIHSTLITLSVGFGISIKISRRSKVYREFIDVSYALMLAQDTGRRGNPLHKICVVV